MIPRFEKFTSNMSMAYKYIIKIKAHEMQEFGLKAAHVMCLFFIGKSENGLTAHELVKLCNEDKSGISKALTVLKAKNYISVNDANGTKKYRTKFVITKEGLEIYDRILVAISNVIEKCNDGLSAEERLIFYSSLEKIVTNLISFYNEMENPNESV